MLVGKFLHCLKYIYITILNFVKWQTHNRSEASKESASLKLAAVIKNTYPVDLCLVHVWLETLAARKKMHQTLNSSTLSLSKKASHFQIRITREIFNLEIQLGHFGKQNYVITWKIF